MTDLSLVQRIFADSLGLASEAVNESLSLETCAAWDSLAHFRVVMAIETQLGRSLTPTEILSISDLASVVTLLEQTRSQVAGQTTA